MLGRVVVGGLVQEVGAVRGDQEAVGEARRDPQLAVVLFAEFHPGPLAEGGRRFAQVDGHVEDAAAGDPHELALGLLDLVVQAAQHTLAGAGVVVLHEVRCEAGGILEGLGVVAFHEEATGIAEDLGFEDQEAGDGGLDDVHQNTLS